jgi:tetratricopeptide (TPR) repeat protein
MTRANDQLAADGIESPVDSDHGPGRGLVLLGACLLALAATRISPQLVESLMDEFRDVVNRVHPETVRRGVTWSTDTLLCLGRVAWPAFLALCLVRVREPLLTRAVALTLAVMGVETFVSVILGKGFGVVFERGGFTFSADKRTLGAAIAAVLLGSARLAVELSAMVLAWKIDFRARRQARLAGERPSEPRAVLSRVMVMGAIGFAAIVFSIQVWDSYIYIVSHDSTFRRMVLRSNPAPSRRQATYRPTKTELKLQDADTAVQQAGAAAARDRFEEAVQLYRKGARICLEVFEEDPRTPNVRRQLSLARNNLAWLFATCPDAAFRDPKRAVALARGAVELLNKDGNSWNTLGVSHYRAGNILEADQALERSMELREGGDSFDWFFVAMIRHAQGREQDAFSLYEKAVEWSDANSPGNLELDRFRREAAAMLNLPQPPALEKVEQRNLAPRPFRSRRRGPPILEPGSGR